MKEAQRTQYEDRITADPRILGGKPVVRGTRIAVSLVLEELAHNPDIKELLAAHPDLTPDKTVTISSQSERDLQELFRRAKKPVALFIDDAHDLHPKTLVALKRLRGSSSRCPSGGAANLAIKV
jgi:uncharacterized protein (DUF433 family)